MSNAATFRAIARALDGTSEAPHFDRTAFKVARIYATLAADKKSANLKFTRDEQEMMCAMNPDGFAPVPNKWGEQGWTTATLSKLDKPQLQRALEMAWQHAVVKKPAARRKR